MLAIRDPSVVLGLCDGEMGRTLKTPALAPDLLQEQPRSLHFTVPRPVAISPPQTWGINAC